MASVGRRLGARNVWRLWPPSPRTGTGGGGVPDLRWPTAVPGNERRHGVTNFEGRTALVTGGSRGIGLGIARSLVDRGARVVLTARKPEALAELLRLLRAARIVKAERQGKQVFYAAADAHISGLLSNMFEHIAEPHTGLDA